MCCRGKRSAAFSIAAGRPEQLHLSVESADEQHDRLCIARFEERRGAVACKQGGDRRSIDEPPDKSCVTVHLYADVAAGRHRRHMIQRGSGIGQIGCSAQPFKNSRGVSQVSRGPRTSTRRGRQPSKLQVAEA